MKYVFVQNKNSRLIKTDEASTYRNFKISLKRGILTQTHDAPRRQQGHTGSFLVRNSPAANSKRQDISFKRTDLVLVNH